MSRLHLTPTDTQLASARAAMIQAGPDAAVQRVAGKPYLKGFGADIGVFELELPEHRFVIGRDASADLNLPFQTVSRTHATVTPEGSGFVLEDAGSTGGTTVNGKRCDRRVLEHGDSIQIAVYTLQYRTHEPVAGAKEAAARAKSMLRSDYCTLPSTMRLRFRMLGTGPRSIFRTGDTLKVGQGGLLIPVAAPPDDDACLELHLAITQNATKRFLGEIMGVIEAEGTHWVCAKLHTIPRDVYDEVVAAATPGDWTDVLPT